MDRVDEICDRCKKPINILVKDFEQAMKNEEPILCPDCYSKFLDEETESLPKRCFEYKIVSTDEAPFCDIGLEGWELVSVYDRAAYFKREYYHGGNNG